MSTARVSVIIPVKNRADLIGQTLENLLNQTLQPHEIIVVDDGSTDDIEAVTAKYQPIVKLVKNKGKGPGAGRNTGLSYASGEFIKFFDSDDVTTLNTLEVQAQFLISHQEPMVYSPYIYSAYENGEWIQKDVIIQYKPIPSSSTLHSCMLYGFFTVIPGMMFRRSFLDQLGPWREDIVAYEDFDYLWRIGAIITNPGHTNDCAMFYRLHGAQTVGSNMNNHSRDKDKVICLSDIIKLHSGALSSFQKLLLNHRLTETYGYLQEIEPYSTLFRQRYSIVNKLISVYLRLSSKLNRTITRSNWQIMHGVTLSKTAFDYYLRGLKKKNSP